MCEAQLQVIMLLHALWTLFLDQLLMSHGMLLEVGPTGSVLASEKLTAAVHQQICTVLCFLLHQCSFLDALPAYVCDLCWLFRARFVTLMAHV